MKILSFSVNLKHLFTQELDAFLILYTKIFYSGLSPSPKPRLWYTVLSPPHCHISGNSSLKLSWFTGSQPTYYSELLTWSVWGLCQWMRCKWVAGLLRCWLRGTLCGQDRICIFPPPVILFWPWAILPAILRQWVLKYQFSCVPLWF